MATTDFRPRLVYVPCIPEPCYSGHSVINYLGPKSGRQWEQVNAKLWRADYFEVNDPITEKSLESKKGSPMGLFKVANLGFVFVLWKYVYLQMKVITFPLGHQAKLKVSLRYNVQNRSSSF